MNGRTPPTRRIPVPVAPAPDGNGYAATARFIKGRLCDIARAEQSGEIDTATAKERRAGAYRAARMDPAQAASMERYYRAIFGKVDPSDTTRRALALAVAFERTGATVPFPAWIRSATHRRLALAAFALGASGARFMLPANRTATALAELTGERTEGKCVRDFWRRGKAHGLLLFKDPKRTAKRDADTGAIVRDPGTGHGMVFGSYAAPIRFSLAPEWQTFIFNPECVRLLQTMAADDVLRGRIERAANSALATCGQSVQRDGCYRDYCYRD